MINEIYNIFFSPNSSFSYNNIKIIFMKVHYGNKKKRIKSTKFN